MDIKRLEVFCKVIEYKSFTRAAEAALISQPTVSEHIRSLEENCGNKLVDRLGREALPTPAGKILYQYARQIIRLRDEATQAMKDHREILEGTLEIGASTIPGAYILPELIETFKSLHPSIQVTLKISGTEPIVEDLIQGELEFALVGAKVKEHLLESQHLFDDELVLVLSPEHTWAKRSSINPAELTTELFIVREKGSGTRLVMTDALKGEDVPFSELKIAAEMGSTEAVRQGVKARLGISILSSLAVADDLKNGTLTSIPLEGLHLTRPIYLTKRKGRQLPPLALSFLNHLDSKSHPSKLSTPNP